VETFPGELIDITTAEIDRWIASFPGKARSKNNLRNAVIGFYNFAQRKDFLPREMDHAAKFLTFFRDPRQTISSEEEAIATTPRQQVYTPDELARMLAKAPADVRVTLELKAFSGIRTEELVRLWWVLINEETGAINITEAVAKLDRRTISMPENLRSRLKAYPIEKKRAESALDGRLRIPYITRGFESRLMPTSHTKRTPSETVSFPIDSR